MCHPNGSAERQLLKKLKTGGTQNGVVQHVHIESGGPSLLFDEPAAPGQQLSRPSHDLVVRHGQPLRQGAGTYG